MFGRLMHIFATLLIQVNGLNQFLFIISSQIQIVLRDHLAQLSTLINTIQLIGLFGCVEV